MEENVNSELIKLYGEFVLKFEFVCSRIRFMFLKILYPNNDEKQRNIIEIMTEWLTADPLRRKVNALMIEFYGKESEIYETAFRISSKFIQFIELRNSFAHGTAFIGQYDFIHETQVGTIALRHPKLKKDGLDLNFKNFNRIKLEELINGLNSLDRAYSNLIIIISHPEQESIFYERFYTQITKELGSLDLLII